MQIVTDRGADLAPQQLEGLKVHFAPLRVTLDGNTYESGVNLEPEAFYQMLSETDSYPSTSQPSAGDFSELYSRLARFDPEILSIHISSGLSGTLNAARAGAEMVPEAHVTFFDTHTLSVPEGWHVQAAARALQEEWPLPKILALLEKIRAQSQGLFTLPTLKYLVHGGRISHIKGLVASLLNIKPIIGVEKEHGTYTQLGQEVTFKRAINRLADVVSGIFPQAGVLRVQLLHGNNMEGVQLLREKMLERFDCFFEPVTAIAPVLGAHTGPGLVGLSAAPMALFADVLK